MKPTLKYGSRVKLHSTSSPDLDNKTGKILGLAFDYPEVKFWIVGFDVPLPDRSALIIIDNCLMEVKHEIR